VNNLKIYKMAKKKTNTLICSECIGEFKTKEMFCATVPNREYSTVYCEKCLKELGIKEFKPYIKPRKPREVKPKTTSATKTKKSTTATKKKSTTATKRKST